ncbi:MAG: molybdenum cofactor biosynthesis protein MoaE [Candidatus Thermoplasmatota archaeon]|nr:molybdenum cofactor biosynthesis protein MoaE [Candidatus Thermoplasmatota archaeon]
MDVQVKVTSRQVIVERVLRWVSSGSAGGTVSFIGTVRNKSDGMKVTRMELEAATDLAEADLKRIAKESAKRFDLVKVAVHHRIGRLKVGDVIVVIAVSAPHRVDAFNACRFVIDELKKTTPIWKKEFSGSRRRWVEGGV